jgi:hypothetical protein
MKGKRPGEVEANCVMSQFARVHPKGLYKLVVASALLVGACRNDPGTGNLDDVSVHYNVVRRGF